MPHKGKVGVFAADLLLLLLTIMAASNVIVASGRIIHVGNSGIDGEGVKLGAGLGVGRGVLISGMVMVCVLLQPLA